MASATVKDEKVVFIKLSRVLLFALVLGLNYLSDVVIVICTSCSVAIVVSNIVVR
jgi:hypothetical protein